MAKVKSVQNNPNAINFVRGLSDPGEMIACGYLPQLRRLDSEVGQDDVYAARILPLVMALPKKERDVILTAAQKRASLDTSNGVVSVACAATAPWHELGTLFDAAFSPEEGLAACKMNWNNVPYDIFYFSPTDPNCPGYDTGDRYVARVRSDTHQLLGITSKNWEPLQNDEMVRFLQSVSKTGEIALETMGSLDGGKRVWALARLGSMFDVVPGDTVKPYALIMNGHGGDLAITIGATCERVVCANTARQALSEKGNGWLKIRHSKGSLKGKVEEARSKLGMAREHVDTFASEARQLTSVKMTGNSVREFYGQFFPTTVKPAKDAPVGDGASLLDTILDAQQEEQAVVSELLQGHFAETERQANRNAKILEQLLSNYEDDTNTLPGVKGTAWAAYNGLTEWVDHQQKHRTADSRFSSTLLGAGDQLKQAAFTVAKGLVAR